MQDDRKTHANCDHGGANQRKIYCALIHGKGEDVRDGLHDVIPQNMLIRFSRLCDRNIVRHLPSSRPPELPASHHSLGS